MGVIWRQDLRRIMKSPFFWISIVICLLCFIESYYTCSDLLDKYYHIGTLNVFIISAIFNEGGFLRIFAPILPVLAFSSSMFDDMDSGYLRLIITRMKFREYLAQRIITTAFSGGAVYFLASLFFWIFCIIIDPKKAPLLVETSTDGVFGSLLFNSMLLYCCLFLLLFSLFGMLQALFAMGVSMCAQNRYVGLIAPSVVYHCAPLIAGIFPHTKLGSLGISYSFQSNTSEFWIGYSFWLILCASSIVVGIVKSRQLNRF